MARDWESEFEEIGTAFYPGSKKPIPDIRKPIAERPRPSNDDWDAKPRNYTVNGQEVEFFTIGQLAYALGRQAVTVRKWEREGVIPKAMFSAPSADPRGKRRLYTREQVEGIIRIAEEEGILLVHQKPIRETRFTERVIELFAGLKVPGA